MVDEDDNEDRRGWKNNTSRQHKPKDSKDYENAPTGHLGFEVVFTPSPSLGMAVSKARSTNAGKITQSQEAAEKPDNRPIAMQTGDKEVDGHYGQSHNLLTEKEFSERNSPEELHAQGKSASRGKPTAQDIFNKFSKDKEHDKDLG